MKRQKLTLWEPSEYHYAPAGSFIPFVMASLHDDRACHPAMVIVPGGAYSILQPTEAEGQARGFYERGYNTFVLVYTNNVTMDAPVGYQALQDISRAVRLLRSRAGALGIDPHRIYASGYSAGAHLVGCLAIRYSTGILADSGYGSYSNRLDAAFLHYPLVSRHSLLGKEAGSPLNGRAFGVLFGDKCSEADEAFMSLDRDIPPDATPICIFHGTKDTSVSWRGAASLADACLEAGVPCELHLLTDSGHGMTSEDGDPADAQRSLYVCEQLYDAVRAMLPAVFADYAPLLGDLGQGMERDEFLQTVRTKTIMKIWMKALGVDLETVLQAMQSQPAAQPVPPKQNRTALLWKEIAVNWLDTIF